MLRLTNVRKAFGATVAVDGLPLSIHQGEVFGLLGPNGAGKTTTVNMAVGRGFHPVPRTAPPGSGAARERCRELVEWRRVFSPSLASCGPTYHARIQAQVYLF
jgi:ABC-type hemin transport system ATPase subunit